jgi:two-component system, cell cycle response regulator DivK
MAEETILVIEDNFLNRKLLKEMLIILGYSVWEAENAENGLDLMKVKYPNLIIMDIQLPGIDGIQATKTIKADPKLSEIPVIALSGHATEEVRKRALAAGVDKFVTKPFTMATLRNSISGLI